MPCSKKVKCYTKFCIVLEVMFLKLHAKLALGWALISVNFELIQEIGQVGALS